MPCLTGKILPELSLNLTAFCFSLSTALTSSVASVCNSGDGGTGSCLDSYAFPPALDSLHRSALSHEEPLGVDGGTADCLNLLDAGFYHAELGPLAVCGQGSGVGEDDLERPAAKRLKMGLAAEPYLSEVGVGVGVEFEARSHHITSTKMAVSVTDFGEGGGGGYMGAHTNHLHQHASRQSE